VSFTPKAFSERLRGAGFASLTGVLKPPDTGSDQFLFSFKPCPAVWIPIPFDAIESIDWLSTVSCKDGVYQAVRILLKTSKSAEGQLLAAVLSTRDDSSAAPPPAAQRRRRPDFGGRQPGTTSLMRSAPAGSWGACMDKCLYQYWPNWDDIVQCQTWVCGNETLPPVVEFPAD